MTDFVTIIVITVKLVSRDVAVEMQVWKKLLKKRVSKGFFERYSIQVIIFQHTMNKIKQQSVIFSVWQ